VSKLTITVRDFKPLHRNTLRGFATIHINEMRLEICDVAIHQKNESNWAQLPAKPMIDRDGVVLRDRETGKIGYATVLEFDNRARARRVLARGRRCRAARLSRRVRDRGGGVD
jgi:hypothetical protein